MNATTPLWTRDNYMAKRVSYADYYRQFVTPADLLKVRNCIGVECVMNQFPSVWRLVKATRGTPTL